jgi:hypothetical protein
VVPDAPSPGVGTRSKARASAIVVETKGKAKAQPVASGSKSKGRAPRAKPTVVASLSGVARVGSPVFSDASAAPAATASTRELTREEATEVQALYDLSALTRAQMRALANTLRGYQDRINEVYGV